MKNLKKSILLFVMSFLLLGHLFAGGGRDRSNNIVVYALSGPSAVGLVRLFDSPPQAEGVTIRAETLANQDLMAARFINGEAQVGVLPPNMAAKLYAEGVDIQVLAVIGNGMLRLLTNDPSIQSTADLRGNTVHVAGQGATPDYVFRRILQARGLNPDQDLTLSYALAPNEMALGLITGRIQTALLPEPFASMATPDGGPVRELLDLQGAWEELGYGTYPMTLLVARREFIENRPQALGAILSGVEYSIAWVQANPVEASLLVERHNLGFPVTAAVPGIIRGNYVFIPALAARPAIERLLGIFYEFNPLSIGSMPNEGFYFSP